MRDSSVARKERKMEETSVLGLMKDDASGQ